MVMERYFIVIKRVIDCLHSKKKQWDHHKHMP